MAETPAVLTVEKVSKSFGGVKALTDIDMTVHRSQTLGLIGPNGSGKTTLFNVISGFYGPTSGRVVLGSRPIQGLPPHAVSRLGVARTFQNIRLFNNVTVRENVLAAMRFSSLGARLGDIVATPGARRERAALAVKADELLGFFGLAEHADKPAASLPYGMRKRLELARAMAGEPAVLLLDEPVAGMNPQETGDMIESIRRLRTRGLTLVVIEHDMKVIMSTCDRIVVLSTGRKLAEGTPHEVRTDPRVVEAYLGKEDTDA